MSRMVLLPGMDGTGTLHDAFTAALRPDVDVIVLDYPQRELLGYPELAQRLAPRLPADGRPYALLGESFGGPLAIELAARRPPGLAGLVLCASFARFPDGWLRTLASIARHMPATRPPLALLAPLLLGRWDTQVLRDALARALALVAPAVLRCRLDEVLRVDVRDRLARIDVPVLHLQATADRLVAATAGATIASAIPGARLVRIEGPHLLLQAAPANCAAALRDFFS